MQRELRRIVSRPLYLISSVGAFLFCLFFYMTLMKAGAAEEMPVAVVDHDQTSISRRLMHTQIRCICIRGRRNHPLPTAADNRIRQ